MAPIEPLARRELLLARRARRPCSDLGRRSMFVRVHAEILHRHVHCVGSWAVGARRASFCRRSEPGQTNTCLLLVVKMRSGSTVTLPVAPSILPTTFWRSSARAHRNSPVSRSQRIYDAAFARHARDDLPRFAAPQIRVDPADPSRLGATRYRPAAARTDDRDPSGRRDAGSTKRACPSRHPAPAWSCDRGAACRCRRAGTSPRGSLRMFRRR